MEKKVEAFIAEYRALCLKYRLFIGGYDDGPFLNDGQYGGPFEKLLEENIQDLIRDA